MTTQKKLSKSELRRRSSLDRGPHKAWMPSGPDMETDAPYEFLIPDASALLRSGHLRPDLKETALLCAAHPDGPDGFMQDLVMTASVTERSDTVMKAIAEGMELSHFLIAEMLVSPAVTPDEVAEGLIPELDIRMLLEFAERRRNMDAAGNVLPITLLGEWATFRGQRAGAAGTQNGGADGPASDGAVPEPDAGA